MQCRAILILSACFLAVAALIGCNEQPPLDSPAAAAETKTEKEPAKGETKKPGGADDPGGKKEPAEEEPKEHRTNRLAAETSPYLLQHARNPVDWYPWGEEAFAKAEKEKKLIFLSVGYSSCHWCHVMEHESFEDEEIAAYLNKHFVCIKVDREERPDVDAIYMAAVQIVTRRGGWPMSVFLTPSAKPFYGGTYFPARDGDRGATTGFLTIVKKVQELWEKEPKKIADSADELTTLVKRQLASERPLVLETVGEKQIKACLAELDDQYDAKYGGFGYGPDPRQPKFPEPSNLIFLLDRVQRDGDERAKEMLLGTLEHMAQGGIYDHLGGGFHRYSVDRYWEIPHFEKMLYDNGQLATVYAEAFALTKREDFKRVVDGMLEFVVREMTDEKGGFYSALDADSEGEEGKFYRWSKEEVEKLLTADEFKQFAEIYGLDGQPNFEEHFYAPQQYRTLAESAEELKITETELESQLVPIRAKLFATRAKRERPLTDTKVLTAWNGLMIRGFADAGRIFENEKYVVAAARAADFVLENLRTENGRLLRTFGGGEAKLNAYLDDYSFFADGLIALFQATGEKKWLDAADQLTAMQIKLFWDETGGGFFFTSEDHESLIARAKNPVDGAQPSGNSVAAQNLVFLGNKLDKAEYLKKAEQTIGQVSAILERAPAAAPRLLVAAAALVTDEEKKGEE